MSHLSFRRSIRTPTLVRLPSKCDQTISHSDGASCPNSPAVKKVFRLVILGSSQTGKTAIVNRFLDKEFEERYFPTIENFHRKLYKIRGEVYQLDVFDRSGNDPFPASRKLAYISGDMFIIVASVDHVPSVEQFEEYWNQIVECKVARGITDKVPIVFALNKTDLPQYKWQVSIEEVEELINSATNQANCENCFISCSAANNENIAKIFGKLFTLAKVPKQMNPELHNLLRNELSADGILTGRKKAILERMRSKFSHEIEDEIIIDVDGRRSSLRTGLLLNRAKAGLSQKGLILPPPSQESPLKKETVTTEEEFEKDREKETTPRKVTACSSGKAEKTDISSKHTSSVDNPSNKCILM